MTQPRGRWYGFYPAAVLLLLLLLHLYLYVRESNPYSLSWFGNLAQAIALLLTALEFSRASLVSRSPDLRPRIFIALAFWIMAMAHGLLSYSELLLNKPATGTITDVIWFVGYALLVRALHLLLKSRVPARNQAIIFFSNAVFVWGVLWIPLTDPARDWFLKFTQFIFPFLDFLVASMALFIGLQTKNNYWKAAAIGWTVVGISDLIFPFYYQMTSPVYRYLDIPLFAGYSMWWLLAVSIRRSVATGSTV